MPEYEWQALQEKERSEFVKSLDMERRSAKDKVEAREDRCNNNANFSHPPSGSADWDRLLVNNPTHPVVGCSKPCVTCLPPPKEHYTQHRVGDRVTYLSSKRGAAGFITWVSHDRTHVKVEMDLQYKALPLMMAGAKFAPITRYQYVERTPPPKPQKERKGQSKGNAWQEAGGRAAEEYRKGLSRKEKMTLEQALLFEDRCQNNHPAFRKPIPDSLDHLKMLVNYKHAVDGETCFTCVPPPSRLVCSLRVGDRVEWLGAADAQRGTVRWASRDRSHVKVQMDDPSLTKWKKLNFARVRQKTGASAELNRSEEHKDAEAAGPEDFEYLFHQKFKYSEVLMMSAAKFKATF